MAVIGSPAGNRAVGHDTTIGTSSVPTPLPCVSGSLRWAQERMWAVAATVLPGIEVDADTFTGTCSSVVHGAPAGTTGEGVAAR